MIGTYRPDRDGVNGLTAPTMDGIPEAPETLPEDAVRVWDCAVAWLHRMGMLAETDLPLVEAYAFNVWLMREAQRQITEAGAVTESPLTDSNPSRQRQAREAGRDSKQTVNKWLSVYRQSFQTVNSLSAQFGLTPSARSRFEMPMPAREKSPWFD